MTKKDYIKLAQALKDSKPNLLPNTDPNSYYFMAIQVWQNTVMQIVETLRLDNPQFSRDRFLHACGYTQEG